jgi:hypothetical protein
MRGIAFSIIGSLNGLGAILSVPSSRYGAYFTSVVIAGFIVTVLPIRSDVDCGLQLILRFPVRIAGGSPGAEAVYLLFENGRL